MIIIETQKEVIFNELKLKNPNIKVLNQNEISKEKKVEITVEFYNGSYQGIIRTIGAYEFTDTWTDEDTINFIKQTLNL